MVVLIWIFRTQTYGARLKFVVNLLGSESMRAFLKNIMTRKGKILARYSLTHLIGAMVLGIALAAWLIMWQGHMDQARLQKLNETAGEATQTALSVTDGAGGEQLPPNTGKIGGSFSLTNQDGKIVTDKDFAGKYLLVYFGYTNCPDMCPTGLQSMSRAMDLLQADGDQDGDKIVQPLFITIDPARDTPARLHDYDAAFHPRIIGLTGTDTQIASVAATYQVYYRKDEGQQDYVMEHTSLIYLLDPGGKLVATFNEEVDPKKIVAALHKDTGKTAVKKQTENHP